MKRARWTFGTQSPACQTLAMAWCEAAGDELLPKRGQLTPRTLKDVLSHLFILEYLSPENIRIRLMGSRLTDMMGGVHLTGLNIIDLVPPDQRPVRIARYIACANYPCGMYYTQQSRLTTGQTIVVEHIVLPILPDQPEDPLQFIAAAEQIEALDWVPGEVLVQNNTYDRVIERIIFVDVGAGIPEQDPGLALMPG